MVGSRYYYTNQFKKMKFHLNLIVNWVFQIFKDFFLQLLSCILIMIILYNFYFVYLMISFFKGCFFTDLFIFSCYNYLYVLNCGTFSKKNYGNLYHMCKEGFTKNWRKKNCGIFLFLASIVLNLFSWNKNIFNQDVFILPLSYDIMQMI